MSEAKEKVSQNRFKSLHHIHVQFGDLVFTIAHDGPFLTVDQLYSALNEIRDNMDLYNA